MMICRPAGPVSQRINAERLVLLGWSRAILLQLAHPLIASAIGAHSSFKGGARAAAVRLRHTVGAMLDLTYGDESTRAQAVARIRGVHDHVHGSLGEGTGLFPRGSSYSAHDPALLLWVHATLLESVVLAHETFVGPLDGHDRDAYCDEAAAVAIALGATAEDVPTTWDALDRYLAAMERSGTIAVGAEARDLAEAVLSPPLRMLGWPAIALNHRFTIGTLPPAIRDQYGFAWTPRAASRLARVARAIRLTRRVTPAFLAKWPSRVRRDRERSFAASGAPAERAAVILPVATNPHPRRPA